MQARYRLTIRCPDQVGIVAAVADFLARHGASIVEANHHTDLEEGWFFMRHEISDIQLDSAAFQAAFAQLAERFQMRWRWHEIQQRQRVALLASKEPHCLLDVLHRWQCEDLPCDIPCVIANHEAMKQYADWFGVPFHFVDFNHQSSTEAFAEIAALLKQYEIDTVVLARFMRIFPSDFCQQYRHRMINIHHSFLPSFVGAKPYHQAYERGVKLIGATCHYVTEDLDEGPIIEQDVVRISHADSLADMVRKGKDCERRALAAGLRMHLQDRVLVHGHKTIVFA
ncbi:MAG: formyltetrahydrofolate deformylase [Xanthomonadales bacterium]|jgi:formyltetrahydrofolate deformylase|nr:formyltetrahydrofolate deformylase [Xanthomonadales bacterium]